MSRAELGHLLKLLESAPRVLIVTHEQPDADAIGTALGLVAALRERDQQVQVGCADPVPQRYRFLPGWEQVTTEIEPAPLSVILDTADWARLGSLAETVRQCPEQIVIDHHQSSEQWGTARYLDEQAPATALQVYKLLLAMGSPITPEIATCLYCGLAGDTGFFTFQNTTAEALWIAGELVQAGADPVEIHRRAEAQLSLSSLRLRGRALAAAQTMAEGRIVYSVLRREDFAACAATDEDTDGVVDLLKSAAGAKVFALFKQAGEQEWRVSLRSRGTEVVQVAREFGGGGHAVAAGFSVSGPEEVVLEQVLSRLQAQVEEDAG